MLLTDNPDRQRYGLSDRVGELYIRTQTRMMFGLTTG